MLSVAGIAFPTGWVAVSRKARFFFRDSPATLANSHKRAAQTWISCWLTLQRADELPRSAAVREPQATATPTTATPGTEEGNAAKPRLVILGSGWASMSLIQALPNNIK